MQNIYACCILIFFFFFGVDLMSLYSQSFLMGFQLIELENNLKEETKLRNKAEKKLRFLKKKLESLNILIPLDQSEQSSSSSDFCAHSCKSSTSTSGPKDSEESESKPQITTRQVSQNLDNNLSDTISSNQSHESASFQESSSSLDTANSSEHSSPRCEDSKPDDNHRYPNSACSFTP